MLSSKAISDFMKGRMLIVADRETRESEGDFICAASLCKTGHINFMVKNGRGLVCAALTEERVNNLNLPMMAQRNSSRFETAFTVSVEAKHGTTTGISTEERALTCRTLADFSKNANDFICPGHIFPLKARNNGVLERDGHTEAAVDLCRIAKLPPVAVLCEILNEDGTMARMPQLLKIAKTHNIEIITVQDIIDYRLRNEKLVKRIAAPTVQTKYGKFKALAYRSFDGVEHIAWLSSTKVKDEYPAVRVHSECITGDIFSSLRCDCGEQLDKSMKFVAENGGVVIYLRGHEGRGIGLVNKLRAYELQEKGMDSVDANLHLGFEVDERSYSVAAQILKDLGLKNIRLLTNNPQKIADLEYFGISVKERLPIEISPNKYNAAYLATKKKRMNHLMDL